MSTCVTPACLYGTETLALTELQRQRLQEYENNWIRKIARVTRADRRRMAELRRDGSAEELDRETGEERKFVTGNKMGKVLSHMFYSNG